MNRKQKEASFAQIEKNPYMTWKEINKLAKKTYKISGGHLVGIWKKLGQQKYGTKTFKELRYILQKKAEQASKKRPGKWILLTGICEQHQSIQHFQVLNIKVPVNDREELFVFKLLRMDGNYPFPPEPATQEEREKLEGPGISDIKLHFDDKIHEELIDCLEGLYELREDAWLKIQIKHQLDDRTMIRFGIQTAREAIKRYREHTLKQGYV